MYNIFGLFKIIRMHLTKVNHPQMSVLVKNTWHSVNLTHWSEYKVQYSSFVTLIIADSIINLIIGRACYYDNEILKVQKDSIHMRNFPLCIIQAAFGCMFQNI